MRLQLEILATTVEWVDVAALLGGTSIITDEGLSSLERYAAIPFDRNDATERLTRSAAPFVRSIHRPTFYFEGAGGDVGAAQWIEMRYPARSSSSWSNDSGIPS